MHPIYAGAAEHRLKDGTVRHFKPTGPMYLVHRPGGETRKRGAKEDFELKPGLSARLFVGLSVGQVPTYTVHEVVDATIQIRESEKLRPDASFIAQKGLYTEEDDDGNAVDLVKENSVQIVIINYPVLSREAFDESILSLAHQLRERFDQKSVIVEIQEAGISQRVVMVTQ